MEIKKIINLFRKMEGYIGLNAEYANEIADFLEEYERRAENLVLHNADLNNCLNKAEAHIGMLEKQLSEKSEWISVEERLPDANNLVLCWWESHDGEREHYGFATFQSHGVWYVSNEGMHKVTYWMPLPEPPKPKVPTFKDVFLEKFPKAPIDEDGIPKACIADVFPWAKHKHCDGWMCSEDWNHPYFEPQGEGEADA